MDGAVLCSISYGPSFGNCSDLLISQDFQNGNTSGLGTTFDISSNILIRLLILLELQHHN